MTENLTARVRAWRTALGVLVLAASLAGVEAGAAQRSDPGVLTLATDVRSGPGIRDAVVATAPAGTRLTVLEMVGASARIQAGKIAGWVPASKVRIGDGGASQGGSGASGGNFFRSMTSLLGGGGASKDVKVTAGARGLTPGALEGASPNPAALRRMQSFQVSRADAQGFARGNGLVARSYAYLSQSGGTTASSGGGGASGGSGGGLGGLLQGLTSGGGAAPPAARRGGSEK